MPLIPAMNVALWPLPPIRIVPDSPALPALAIATLFEPVVRFSPAPGPSAMLRDPVVLANSALLPVATLAVPVVFENRALLPVATLPFAVVFENSASRPVATLSLPVVLEPSAGAAGRDVVVAGRRWRPAHRCRWRRCCRRSC